MVAGIVALSALAAAGPVHADHSHLAGRWALDNDAAEDMNVASDASGHGNHGVNSATETTTPGRFDAGYRFFGDSSVAIPGASVLEPPQVTVAAWVRSDEQDQGALKYVLAKGDNSCQGASWAFYTGRTGSPNEGGLGFYVYDGSPRSNPAVPTWTDSPSLPATAIWDNQWHAIAGTFDGATVRFYVDGAEVGSGTSEPDAIAYAFADRRLLFGRSAGDGCPLYWSGRMDEVRVYRRALSAAEIATLHDPTATTPPVLPEPSGEEPPPPPPPPPPDEPPGPPPPGTGAQFTVDRDTVPAFGRVRLDASGSVPPGGRAASFLWDLNSDGTPEADCGPETPVLDTPLTRSTTAQLTVVDAFSGGRTTSSRALTVGARGRAAQVGALRRSVGRFESLVTRAPLTPTCRPGPGGAGGADTTALGGPPAGCVDSMQAYVALVEAVGCLQAVEDGAIPSPERRLLVNAVAPGTFLPGESKSALITGRFGARAAGGPARDLAEGREDAARFTALLRGTLLMSDRTVRVNGLDYTPTRRSRLLIVQPGIFAERRTPYVIGVERRGDGGHRRRPDGEAPLGGRDGAAGRPVGDGDRAHPDRRRRALRAGHPAAGPRARDARAGAQPDHRPDAPARRLRVGGRPGHLRRGALPASNRDGIRLDGFGIENVDAAIFGVGVHIDYLRYVSSLRHFEGKAGVSIPPLGAIEGTLHVRGDTIELLDITYFPQAPGIKVAPGLPERGRRLLREQPVDRPLRGRCRVHGRAVGRPGLRARDVEGLARAEVLAGAGDAHRRGPGVAVFLPAAVPGQGRDRGRRVRERLRRDRLLVRPGLAQGGLGRQVPRPEVHRPGRRRRLRRGPRLRPRHRAHLRQGAGVLRRVRAGRRRRGPRLAAGPVAPGDHRPARHHVLRLRRR